MKKEEKKVVLTGVCTDRFTERLKLGFYLEYDGGKGQVYPTAYPEALELAKEVKKDCEKYCYDFLKTGPDGEFYYKTLKDWDVKDEKELDLLVKELYAFGLLQKVPVYLETGEEQYLLTELRDKGYKKEEEAELTRQQYKNVREQLAKYYYERYAEVEKEKVFYKALDEARFGKKQ